MVTLLTIGLLGGASAGVIQHFASVEGSGTVGEAVAVSGTTDIDFSTQSQSTYAPETFQNTVTLQNNNDEESVDYTWKVTENEEGASNGDTLSFVNTGIYQVESFDLYNVQYGQQYESVDDTTEASQDVEVYPGIEETTYSIDYPSSANWVNVEITPETGDNYHIIYDGSTFQYKQPSKSGSAEPADQFNKFVSGNEANGEVNITVERAEDYSQSFFVHLDTSSNSAFTKEAVKIDLDDTEDYTGDAAGAINGPGYSDSGEFGHETFDMTDLIGDEVVLEGGVSQTYNFVTEFTEQTGQGSYTVTADAEP